MFLKLWEGVTIEFLIHGANLVFIHENKYIKCNSVKFNIKEGNNFQLGELFRIKSILLWTL